MGGSLRRPLGHLVGASNASAVLSAVATGMVTLTSITFSVLLLAIQQTAATLSPVVLDQFVRRRSNQVYLGFFVGVCIYAYMVLAAVQHNTPPVLGAALALVLTVVALLILLTLVYSTLNQMRPVYVIAAIRTHALAARERELALIHETRRTTTLTEPPQMTACSERTGYVASVDIEAMRRACRSVPNAEVELVVTLGQHVIAGEAIAHVRGGGEHAGALTAAFRDDVVTMNRQRDIDNDAAASIEDLANIAWTSGSSAKHNPEIAAQGLNALRDLLHRWSEEDDPGLARFADALPVTYRDDRCERLVDALLDLVAVAHESQQQQTMSRVLAAFTFALPSVREPERDRAAAGLEQAAPFLAQGTWTPKVREAAARVTEVLLQVDRQNAAQAIVGAFQHERESHTPGK